MYVKKGKKSGSGDNPEATLYKKAQVGCSKSMDLLMEQHEGLVCYAANRQQLGDLPFDEAVQAGRYGL